MPSSMVIRVLTVLLAIKAAPYYCSSDSCCCCCSGKATFSFILFLTRLSVVDFHRCRCWSSTTTASESLRKSDTILYKFIIWTLGSCWWSVSATFVRWVALWRSWLSMSRRKTFLGTIGDGQPTNRRIEWVVSECRRSETAVSAVSRVKTGKPVGDR